MGDLKPCPFCGGENIHLDKEYSYSEKPNSSDLIYRQAAIDAAEKESQVDGAYGYMDTKSIVDLLNNLPAAQPEIIRCKDCKWSDWYDSTDGNRYCYCMETGASGRTADDFCSYAERRTDAETEV